MATRRIAALIVVLASIAYPPGAVADWCCRIAFERFTGFSDLGEAQDAAVSPDGRHLYEARSGGLRVLSVAAGNGLLRQREVHTTLPADGDLPLDDLDAWRVIVSPDGAHVYVTHKRSSFAYGIAVYRRDASSGRLQFLQRFGDDSNHSADRMVFSRDGLYLYTSRNNLRVYRRNRNTGALTLLETVLSPDGFNGRGPLAVSPDGRNVYLGAIQSGDSDGLAIYDRDPTTGLLGNVRSLLAGDAGVQGLTNPTGLVFDPGGGDVYISSRQPAVSRYSRDANGDLSFVEIVTGGENSAPPRFFDSSAMVMLLGEAMLAMLDLRNL